MNTMMKIILLIVALLALAHVTKACDDKHKDVGSCNIKYHVCDQIHGTSMEYQCDAMDEADGENYRGDWHGSADSACEESTFHLFQKLDAYAYNNYPCNCEVQQVDQATCHLQIGVCFYFLSKDDVKHGIVHYKGFAFDADPESQDHEGYSYDQEDPQVAGQMAANDLFANFPDTAQKCGQQQTLRGAVDAAVVNVTSIIHERMKSSVKL